jgi:hypothetical protein
MLFLYLQHANVTKVKVLSQYMRGGGGEEEEEE